MKSVITSTIDRLVRDSIAPTMKALGFRRKGQRFWRSAGRTIQLLEIERWKYNLGDTGGFRATVGIFVPEAWLLYEEARPGGEVFSATEPPIQNCPAQLNLDAPVHSHPEVPHGFWVVAPHADLDAVIRSFLSRLESNALPWWEAHSSLGAVLELLESKSVNGEWWYSACRLFIACLADDKATAEIELGRVIARPVHKVSFPAAERDAFIAIAARYGVTNARSLGNRR